MLAIRQEKKMGNYVDYSISIETNNPLLIDQLVKVNNEEKTFLQVFSKTPVDDDCTDYSSIDLEENVKDTYSFKISFCIKYGTDEKIFDQILDEYNTDDYFTFVHAKIHDEIGLGIVTYNNGEWGSMHPYDEEEEDE